MKVYEHCCTLETEFGFLSRQQGERKMRNVSVNIFIEDDQLDNTPNDEIQRTA
jgi:hypothetical protein